MNKDSSGSKQGNNSARVLNKIMRNSDFHGGMKRFALSCILLGEYGCFRESDGLHYQGNYPKANPSPSTLFRANTGVTYFPRV
jgi:hypothetical protein